MDLVSAYFEILFSSLFYCLNIRVRFILGYAKRKKVQLKIVDGPKARFFLRVTI